MAGERTAIFGQLIERMSDSEISYEDRLVVYELMLEVFEDFDVKNLNEYLDIDRAFDQVWYEKYPDLKDDSDDGTF